MKRTIAMILVGAIVLLFVAGPVVAQSSDADVALVYLGAAQEESGADNEEVWSAAQDLGYDHVVYAIEAEMYLSGNIDEVTDLDDNDLTDVVDEVAGDADDIDDLVELDEVTDATDELIAALE